MAGGGRGAGVRSPTCPETQLVYRGIFFPPYVLQTEQRHMLVRCPPITKWPPQPELGRTRASIWQGTGLMEPSTGPPAPLALALGREQEGMRRRQKKKKKKNLGTCGESGVRGRTRVSLPITLRTNTLPNGRLKAKKFLNSENMTSQEQRPKLSSTGL